MENEQVRNIYNKKIKDEYKREYEYNRWFKDAIRKAGYDMTLDTIKKHVVNENFHRCLELGPGHGTWTSVIIESKPDIKMDLVDISKEMLELVRERFKNRNNLKFFESDFLDFDSQDKYDYFFSSRALEYIDDKEKAVKKIMGLLNENGKGFIITKTPKYLRNKILRKKISDFHKGQIEPAELVKLLNKNGVESIEIYPVAMSFPILKSVKVNMFLFNLFSKINLNIISKFFTESYCIKFSKK